MSVIEASWTGKTPLSLLLLPLSWLFCLIVWIRRRLYRHGVLASHRLPVPVLVIGNISVGGTGKTPLVIWLARQLSVWGYRPGIITRGYGGRAARWPQRVDTDSDPALVGDEPVLLARRTGCPVYAGPDRPVAGYRLLQAQDCDILLSDDGLQHYALKRDLEIAVIDGRRRHGNGFCLPAGPLRELPSRLRSVDLVVVNGEAAESEYGMTLNPGYLLSLADPYSRRPLTDFAGQRVHGVAAIGAPGRFFSLLRAYGVEVIEHAWPDHHQFAEQEIAFGDALPVVMTEKDAVKCFGFARPAHWYLPVEAMLTDKFVADLHRALERAVPALARLNER